MSHRVWKFGDDINTDQIIPGRYLSASRAQELAPHLMEDVDADFMQKVKPGDVIVGGKNFGCGSSREHAPLAIKGAGIACVIAPSFARIFYRNAINIGLPIFESPEAARKISQGDLLAIEPDKGIIKNETTGEEYSFQPFPQQMQEIIDAGGLINFVKAKMDRRTQSA
ncbi:MAG: 3-isopropylmalate dehydratase [Planctomycetes bacterium DG_23]|nr:MAG: 3-isopropylmalate dehydratase [Planctomycetes bacterium DG_23]